MTTNSPKSWKSHADLERDRPGAIHARIGRLLFLCIFLPALVLSLHVEEQYRTWLEAELQAADAREAFGPVRELLEPRPVVREEQLTTVYVDPRALFALTLILAIQMWAIASRLHDLGLAGWAAVPGVLLGWLLCKYSVSVGAPAVLGCTLVLAALRGQAQSNRWGPPPHLLPTRSRGTATGPSS